MHTRFFAHFSSSHTAHGEVGKPDICKDLDLDVWNRVESASDTLGTKIGTNVGGEAKTIGA